MKCPNCGEELKEGYLYCEKCGEEIRIVPDFEPEIENSIIETLSAVAEDVIPPIQEETIEEDVFAFETPPKTGKVFWVISILLFIITGGVVAFLITRDYQHADSFQDKVENAKNAYVNKQYKEAANLFEDVLKTQYDGELLISYADCLYEMGETDRALSNYYAAIELDPENEMAYARIITMYEENDEFEEINKLLMSSNSEKIRTAFQNYIVLTPEYNYESGTYNRAIPLKISTDTSGEIYYTLNGTDPMRYGSLYTSPVFLKSGTYNIKAVCINDYGICSDIAEAQYVIEEIKPKEPEVELPSGQYTTPQKITVVVPQGCTVYYTTNGSTPDESSFIYGEPIPMKEGVTNYRFISVSEDGAYSDVVARSYQLTVATEWPAQESITRLKWRLLQKNILLEFDGSLADKKGKNIYVYDSLQIIDGKTMHVINEYYQEGNNVRNMTGTVYCVDLSNGYVYRIIKDEGGNDILEPI